MISTKVKSEGDISRLVGKIPYRIALAGGWIDQPFVSRLNPNPPGSMVVFCVEPTFRFMDRCGMGTSTRKAAYELWNGEIPEGDPAQLVGALYAAENRNSPEPSGSQDMAGILYPGVNRLDYDFNFEGGYFPIHVESNNDPAVAAWLEDAIHIVPVAPRPDGYNPLGIKNLVIEWIERLGQSGKDCFTAIIEQDIQKLGASFNECMICWEALLPQTVRHPLLKLDLMEILGYYQSYYPGAMYSGCGGGYLIVASEEPVPGSIQVKVRVAKQQAAR
ncbi:MAG TPA: hypothetical protein VMT46_06610 [Anaerolineaceae bacterium]|nr:hypothetical protein [Anaerolineaceae bacterium]